MNPGISVYGKRIIQSPLVDIVKVDKRPKSWRIRQKINANEVAC